jgi:uncharacterized membrane protein YkoI
MLTTLRKTATTVVALGALGMGGAALAGAADNSTTSPGSSSSANQARDRGPRAALSADVAAKVEQAALDKVPGATVLEIEAGGPDGTAYHAHIRTADGTREVVLVNAAFQATAVQADNRRGGRGGRVGPGGGHGGPGAETALTGDTKSKVEAAVLAKYPGATIERTETNAFGSAPYESHITTSAGTELEVHVSKDFAVLDARQHP